MAAANVYGQEGLDRLVERRRDLDWFARLLTNDATRFVLGWRERLPVLDTPEGPRLAAVDHRALAGLALGEPVLLGAVDEAIHVAIDATDSAEAELVAALPAGARLAELREIGALLPGAEAAMAASHRGVLLWHAAQRHCGRCGAPTVAVEAGHTLNCTNTSCGATHHPRIDPAAITLVTDGDRVLLGRNRRRPGSIFTCFAGFVEAGESLEGAAAREVLEEVGVRLSEVRYHSSQPWPFPAQIMVGFIGTPATLDIRLDEDEIAEARWFTREELASLPPDGAVQLPRGDSVARRMINGWIRGEI
ncbi:MAG: NAD(+) diphosphatase [Dehalococcoidia bacterium]